MIRVEHVSKHFGGVKAVNDTTLSVERGSITGLIGPNGAGKTTLFNLIAGTFEPTAGTIYLDGEDVTGLKPHELFHKGLLRTFQLAHEFSTLTVIENLMMVPGGQAGEQLWDTWLRPGKVRAREAEVERKAHEVAEFINLGHIKSELAGNLSGGQKKLLELGRTMMVDAKVVLLDEVGAGVNRTLLATIGDAIQRLNREFGYTFCMIEHDMDFISRLCNPVIVMAEGTVMTQGTAEEVKANEEVIEAYLGGGLKNKKTPEANTKPTSKTRPKVEARAESKAGAKPKSKTKPEAKLTPKAEAKTNAKPKAAAKVSSAKPKSPKAGAKS